MPNKVKTIDDMASPQIVKKLSRFVGMINFYRDMWQHRFHMLTPLTNLIKVKSKAKFIWEAEHEKYFQSCKQALRRDVLLAYPDLKKPFDIHTDASDYQLGSVISQEG